MIRDYGQGGKWYVIPVHYPTAFMAKRAFDRAESKLDMSAGDEGIGLYRLAPNPDANTVKTGMPPGVHPVVAVTLDNATARKAAHLLRDGTSYELTESFADALILRRARMVVGHEGETGRVLIRRPEGRGARITAGGDVIEPVGSDD